MISDEIDELRGRLTALSINYPDMSVRLDDTVKDLDRLLYTPGLMQYVINDLLGLREYFTELYEIKELRRDLKPVLDLINGLLEPV